MGKIYYGAIATELRGSIGGTTFQRNKHGFTIKNKANMVKPSGNAVVAIQANMALCTSTWQGMSPGTRADFLTFASVYPQYSKNNPASSLSGYEIFLMWNATRLFCMLNVRTSIVISPCVFATIAPTLAISGGHLKFNLNDTGGNSRNWWGLCISPAVKDSINYIGSRTRYITIVTISQGLSDIDSLYVAVWGTAPIAGQTVFIRLVPFCSDAPQVNAASIFKLIVS